MAHIIEANDVAEVTIACHVSDQYTMNVLHFICDSVTGATVTDDHAALAFSTQYHDLYKALLAADAEFWGVRVQIIDPVRYDAQTEDAHRDAGEASGQQLPPQVAGVIAFKTGFANRSQMGRMYVPACGEAGNADAGVPDTPYLDAMTAITVALAAGCTVSGGGNTAHFKHVVWSRLLPYFTPVTEYRVRDKWGTIRKRSNIGHIDVAPF